MAIRLEQQAEPGRRDVEPGPSESSDERLSSPPPPAAKLFPEDPLLADDSRSLLVERILATPDFVRSPRLAEFLRYICVAALVGRSNMLSEQHIGEVVFGRARDYDSSADTIVRSHALRLRRRLEQYAQRAGKHDLFRLEIPRGGYVPLFIPNGDPAADELLLDAASSPGAEEALPEVELKASVGLAQDSLADAADERVPGSLPRDEEASALAGQVSAATGLRNEYRTAFLLTLGFALALAATLGAMLYKRAPESHLDSRRDLWNRLFTTDQPTRIVLGDSGLVLFHAVAWQYVSLHDYLSEDYTRQMASVQHVDPGFAEFLRGRRYTSMVDAATLGRILRLPQATPDRTLVQYARDMRLNDFKSGNLILIGAEEADPWVELFERSMDFVFSTDTPDHHAVFCNRKPARGEQAEYLSTGPSAGSKLYAVIAFLPNLSATGNVLLLEGSSMPGTESAVDLAMDQHRLMPLLDSIRKPDGTLPHFEMLLESDALKDSAGPARVVALHIHP